AGAFDEDDLLRVGCFSKHFAQLLLRAEFIFAAADEELRLGALAQEGITIKPIVDLDRRTETNDRLHARVGTGSAHASRGTARESAENDRQVEVAVEPVERGADVVDLAATVVVAAFA